jgi:hypothetical protein
VFARRLSLSSSSTTDHRDPPSTSSILPAITNMRACPGIQEESSQDLSLFRTSPTSSPTSTAARTQRIRPSGRPRHHARSHLGRRPGARPARPVRRNLHTVPSFPGLLPRRCVVASSLSPTTSPRWALLSSVIRNQPRRRLLGVTEGRAQSRPSCIQQMHVSQAHVWPEASGPHRTSLQAV